MAGVDLVSVKEILGHRDDSNQSSDMPISPQDTFGTQ